MATVHYRGGGRSYLMMSLLVAIFAILGMGTAIANKYAVESEKFTTTGAIIYSVFMISVLVMAVNAFNFKFLVTDEGCEIIWGPFKFPRRKIAWEKIVSVEAILVRPTEWGGWGYRINPFQKSSAVVLRKGPGLKFVLSKKRVFVVTLDDAAGALAVIEKVIPHNHSTCGHQHDDWTTYLKPD